VCNFCEVLHGYGGAILDWNDPTKVTVQSPEAVQALTEMVRWIGTISPSAVTTYIEVSTRSVWQNGATIFMRNWPYAYALAQMPSASRVANKFDVCSTLPGGGHGTTGHSNIGGWQLAINAFSDSDRQQAAWEFIKYMLTPEAQKIAATVAAWAVTLKSMYEDNDVLARVPLFKQLQPIIQTALPRPVTPRYPDVSAAIQLSIYQALTKQVSPANALAALAGRLRTLVQRA
jgi:ABC-type glycerol-3-phosphate transport system substrate-binding protein